MMPCRPQAATRDRGPTGPRALAIVAFLVILAACSPSPTNSAATHLGRLNDDPLASVKEMAPTSVPTVAPPTAAQAQPDADQMAVIALGDPIKVGGSGASVEGGTVRITAGGTYGISGKSKNVQIIVDTADKRTVKLVLNGVDIASAASAPIYVKRAKTTVITLADGTENRVSHAASNVLDDLANEPDAAIFSDGNLVFDGRGSLAVEATYRNGIASKDELTIISGNITVNAAHDGIRGRDYIAIENGNITVNARSDGMQSSNDQDTRTGFISIEGGTINVTAGEDGMQAAAGVVIRGGTIRISSGGGSAAGGGGGGDTLGELGQSKRSTDDGPSVSAKGIKASDVDIEGGQITMDSADDAIHSHGRINIDGGKIVLASRDQGIHSDATLAINGGDITITRSYEAIESPVITVNGGQIRLAASDDGINIADSTEHASTDGRPGQDSAKASADKHLTISGGYVVIDATGDGMDINGRVKMAGGTVIINGPKVDFNGALDYDREFTMAGGTLVAVGSFGMAEAPDATSTQSSLSVNLGSPQPAGTLVHVEAADGTGILTFAPSREFQSVVFSSSELKKGSTYDVYVGGTSTGSIVDGVYSEGTYSPGRRVVRVRI